jgi:HEAT repeat protein
MTVGRDTRERADLIVRELHAASPASRRWLKLMIELQRVSPDIGMEALRASLHSGDRRSCAGAQQVLVGLGSEEAAAALAESLQSADSVAVAGAARLLSRMRAHSAIPALIRCLEGGEHELDQTAKRSVTRALGAMPHRDEVPVLAKLLRDPNRRTRTAAARAIAQIRAPEAQTALESAASELSWFRGRSVRRALHAVRGHSASG